jgi:nucleoside-diphosphate-sugar epimerase
MRIFITGDKGMIGRDLVRVLRRDEACTLINDEPDWNEFKAGAKVDFEEFPSGLIHEEEIDITGWDMDRFIDLSEPDLVINCAGIVNTIKCEAWPWSASSVNEAGVYNLLNAMKKSKKNINLIHFSTTAIYDPDYYDGEFSGQVPILEEAPIGPKTIYGITKYGGELIVKSYYPKELWSIVRPCFIYDYNSHSVVSQMIQWWETDKLCEQRDAISEIGGRDIFLDPLNKKDYMYVDDFTDIMMLMIFTPFNRIAGEDYNISLGEPTKFREIQFIFEQLGFSKDRYNVHPGGDYLKNHIVKGDKTKHHFPEWEPRITIEQGIKKMMEKSNVLQK